MTINIPEQIEKAVNAARRIKREAQFLNDTSGSITVTRLTRSMTVMQSGFEDAMSALGALRTQLTDSEIAARREFAEDISPPLTNPVGTLGTPEAPGPLLQAGAAVRIAFETDVLPALGAIDQGNGTYLIPSEVWNSGVAKSDGTLEIPQASWSTLKTALPQLIAELEAFG